MNGIVGVLLDMGWLVVGEVESWFWFRGWCWPNRVNVRWGGSRGEGISLCVKFKTSRMLSSAIFWWGLFLLLFLLFLLFL